MCLVSPAFSSPHLSLSRISHCLGINTSARLTGLCLPHDEVTQPHHACRLTVGSGVRGVESRSPCLHGKHCINHCTPKSLSKIFCSISPPILKPLNTIQNDSVTLNDYFSVIQISKVFKVNPDRQMHCTIRTPLRERPRGSKLSPSYHLRPCMQGHNSNSTTGTPGALTEVHHDCLGLLGPGHCHACPGTFYSSSYCILSVLELFGLVQSQEIKGKTRIYLCVQG